MILTLIDFSGIIVVKVEKGTVIRRLPPERRKAMAISKAQQKAVTKYVKSKYDRFGLTMPKGNLDTIKAHAEAQGQSVNAYINTAIDEKMSREAVGSHTRPVAPNMALDATEGGSGVLGPSEGRTGGVTDED